MTKFKLKSLSLAVMLSTAASPMLLAQGDEARHRLEEIVVTATKRDESLLNVPVSVAVFTEAEIQAAGISRPADFMARTPNVTFIEDNAGEAYINIRGQTSVRNSDPNVAIVIDGVTLSSVKPFNQDLFDIQQIEVLKGPQSALYGRNAAAGAIVITTKRPAQELEGSIIGEFGRFDTARATASISGPLTENLGFALSGHYRETDGPFSNVTTGEKVHRFRTSNARARLMYEKDALLVDFRLGGHSSGGGGSAYNAQMVGLPIGGFPGTGLDANNTNMPFVSNVRGEFDEDFIDAILKVEYDFGFATLTSITAANRLEQYFASDSPPYIPDTGGGAGATVQQYTYDDENISQEIRLTSQDDQALRWQAGVYFLQFERDQTSKIGIDTIGKLPSNRNRIEPPDAPQATVAYGNPLYKTTNYAPFASVQYDITDSLHLSVAGRYDIEKREIREGAPDMLNPLTGVSYNDCVALTGVPASQCKDSTTFKQFQPKVSLTYDISPAMSTYVSWGKGFKSGGFNPIGAREALIGVAQGVGLPASSVYVNDRYSKELSTSYEVGFKGRFFDDRLAVNAAVFRTDIEGAQQFEFHPSVGLQTTVSVDEVEIVGFDIDFDALLPTGTRLYGGYGYVDAEVSKFKGNPGFVGNVAPGSFEYTVFLGLTQTFDFSNGLSLTPRVEYNRQGPIWWDVANSSGTEREPLDLVNARLTVAGGDRWELSAYGDNLTNKKYFQEVVPLLGVLTVNYRGPIRSYGVEARYNF